MKCAEARYPVVYRGRQDLKLVAGAEAGKSEGSRVEGRGVTLATKVFSGTSSCPALSG